MADKPADHIPINRLYESDNYIVVNKPYDMYINSDNSEQENTLTSRMAQRDSHRRTSTDPLHFAHRLDYATSGAICIAKNKMSAAAAGKLFERRLARKYYVAVVNGIVRGGADIEYCIGEDAECADGSHRMRALLCRSDTVHCRHARSAATRLLPLEHGRYEARDATLVLLKPSTGRRHQLRVHCAAAAHVVVGDYTYSSRADHQPHRMFLHALRLVLPLPTEIIDTETPEPFFSDAQFLRLWTRVNVLYDLKSEQDRQSIYRLIDSEDFALEPEYRLLKYNEE